MRAWGEEPGRPAGGAGPPAAAGGAAAAEELSPRTRAEGWAQFMDPEGKPYYHNRQTGVTQWGRPQVGPLPLGWTEHFDEKRRMWYYHCVADGKVQWKRPTEPAPAAWPPVAAQPPLPAQPLSRPAPESPQQSGTFGVPQHAASRPASETNPFEPMTETPPRNAASPTAGGAQGGTRDTGSPTAGGARGSTVAGAGSSWSGWQGTRGAAVPKQPPTRPRPNWEPHVPCLLHEAVSNMLNTRNRCQDGTYDGLYVDCTFGRGGHSRHILRQLSDRGRLVAFDVDPEAVAVARRLEQEDSRFKIMHRPFSDIDKVLRPNTVDGVLIDLGVSSPQLDDGHRGFTDRRDEVVDMRMNQSQGVSVAVWLRDSGVSPEELAWIIHKWGEDSDSILSERIAALLHEEQRRNPGVLWRTKRLGETIWRLKKTDPNGMPVSKLTMQALRIWINQEMHQMEVVLHGACNVLKERGQCCVITFKKKEQELLTKFVREHEDPEEFMIGMFSSARLSELYPLMATDKTFCLQQVAVVKPSWDEVQQNNRSRSSVVHVIRKDARTPMHPLAPQRSRPMEERQQKPREHLAVPFQGTAAPHQEVVDYDWVNGLQPQPPQPEASAAAAAAAYGAAPAERGRDPWQEGHDPWAASAGPSRALPPAPAARPQQTPAPALAPAAWPQQTPPPPLSARGPAQGETGAGALPPPPANARGPEPGAAAQGAGELEGEDGFVARKVVKATSDFFFNPQITTGRHVNGYLNLRRGDVVHVLYDGSEGTDAEETGWYYGRVPGETHEPGWFPSNRMEPLTLFSGPAPGG